MKELTLNAPAKINLTLDILRRRPDGYHDLRMVMQTVSLHDTVRVRMGTGGGIAVHTRGVSLPEGPGNLAWKAAAAFLDATGLSGGGMEIEIEKRIPVCAGMAGGSADGAAVLRALRKMLAPEMPERELESIGEKVGSDVPFCVRGGAALAEGRGERLTALPSLPACTLVICKPAFGISTPELYGRVKTDRIQRHPDNTAMCRALQMGNLADAAGSLRNVFEEVLHEKEQSGISAIETELLKYGALNAVMTGSGPTVFGIFQSRSVGENAARLLKTRWEQTFLAEPV